MIVASASATTADFLLCVLFRVAAWTSASKCPSELHLRASKMFGFEDDANRDIHTSCHNRHDFHMCHALRSIMT